MTKRILITLMTALAMAGSLQARPEPPPLEPHIAQNLIARIIDTRTKNIKVGSVTYGSMRTADGFEHKDACRVTVVVEVRENGVVAHRVQHYGCIWNCSYGWFHQKVAIERGGEALDIWTERSDDFTVK